MSKLVMLVGAVVAALGLALAGPASERGPYPHPAEARTPALTVTVACKATPETTRVKNTLNRAITIKAVGSIYRPFGYEPVRVERKLGAGKTVTFESGAGADRNKLTGSFIYNNDVGSREGARVRTSVGAFTDKCTGPAEAAPAVEVVVDCDSDPESTQVRNNTNRAIKIKTVSSIYRPYTFEPFVVNRSLKPNRTITFQSGSKANGRNELTTSYIYNSDVGSKEGARVRTSVDTFIDKC